MANKRQRQAHKRFRELHPGAPEDRPNRSKVEGNQGSVDVQKKAAKKRKRADDCSTSSKKRLLVREDAKGSKDESEQPEEEPASASYGEANVATDEKEVKREKVKKRHPLRVPGKKPGDGCFICHSKDHIAKDCPEKVAQDRKKMCLQCRQWGHTLKNCPTEVSLESKLCYNCGDKGHRLAECKQPLKDGGTSFAECFLCKQSGHLSKNCPSNPHGIYPKGGSCKICGEVSHLAKDCPNKEKAKAASGRTKLKIDAAGAVLSNGGKRTVFRSGDDLEDDFVEGGDDAIRKLDFSSDQENDVSRVGTTNKPSQASKKPSRAATVATSSKKSRVVTF